MNNAIYCRHNRPAKLCEECGPQLAPVPSQSEYEREVRRLKSDLYVLSLELGPQEFISIIGAVQLALRHPGAGASPTLQIARGVKDKIINHVGKTYPLIASYFRASDNPNNDCEVTE